MDDQHWSRPPVIIAPSHVDRGLKLRFGISDDLAGWRNANFRSTPIFMLWAHCVGQLPPINAIGLVKETLPTPTLMTLMDANACFQGVCRPHLSENDGENVLVYVLRPKVTIEYRASLACVARALEPKVPFVLTVQAVLNGYLQDSDDNVSGRITRVEPVASDAGDVTLPVGFENRYRKRCW